MIAASVEMMRRRRRPHKALSSAIFSTGATSDDKGQNTPALLRDMSRWSMAPSLFRPAARGSGAVIASTEAGVLGNHAGDVQREIEASGDEKNSQVGRNVIDIFVIWLAPGRAFGVSKHWYDLHLPGQCTVMRACRAFFIRRRKRRPTSLKS
jgi:hypothetical protein